MPLTQRKNATAEVKTCTTQVLQALLELSYWDSFQADRNDLGAAVPGREAQAKETALGIEDEGI